MLGLCKFQYRLPAVVMNSSRHVEPRSSTRRYFQRSNTDEVALRAKMPPSSFQLPKQTRSRTGASPVLSETQQRRHRPVFSNPRYELTPISPQPRYTHPASRTQLPPSPLHLTTLPLPLLLPHTLPPITPPTKNIPAPIRQPPPLPLSFPPPFSPTPSTPNSLLTPHSKHSLLLNSLCPNPLVNRTCFRANAPSGRIRAQV